MVYEMRRAKPGEYEAALDLLSAAFSQPRENFIKYERLPWFRYRRQKWLGLLNGKMISNVDLFTREIYIGKCAILAGDIGHVSTHPDYRDLGYCSRLIGTMLRKMEREGYNISFLFGGVPHFYEKLGWVPFPEKAVSIKIQGETKPTNCELEMHKFERDEDFDDIVEAYHKYDYQRTGSTVRTREYWLRYREWMVEEPNILLTWKEGGEIKAFSLCEKADNSLRILWICYERGDNEILSTILKGTVNHALKDKCDHVNVGFLPLDHPMLGILNKIPGEIICRYNNSMMVRLINIKSLFEKIVPELEERLERSPLKDWEGSITLGCELGGATLVVDGGKINIEDGRTGNIRLALDKKSLIKLILGHTTFKKMDHYLGLSQRLKLTKQEAELLGILFPKQDPIQWAYGHF